MSIYLNFLLRSLSFVSCIDLHTVLDSHLYSCLF